MAKNGTKTSKQGSRFAAALAVFWRTFYRDASDVYRPELHYMRGPGPKWRAKHGIAEPGTQASPIRTHATPAAA